MNERIEGAYWVIEGFCDGGESERRHPLRRLVSYTDVWEEEAAGEMLVCNYDWCVGSQVTVEKITLNTKQLHN